MNEFTIGYMINPGLNVNRTFREQVEKCMCDRFSAITKPFIKATLLKKKTKVLAIILSCDTRTFI